MRTFTILLFGVFIGMAVSFYLHTHAFNATDVAHQVLPK